MISRNILIVTIFLLFSSSAFAAHIDLAWDPNSEPDLAGYVVYYGTSPQNYTNRIDVGNVTSVRIKGLPANKDYFIALTAYDFSGNESDFSNEVSGFPVPGDDPLPGNNGVSSSSGCFIGRVTQ